MLEKSSSVEKKIASLISLYEKNLLDEALVEAKVLSKQYPDNPSIYNIHGIINASLGNYKQSVDCFSRSIKLDPNNSKTYNNLASAFHNLNQFEEAIINYNKSIKIKPDFAKAHFNLGKTLNDLERFDEAILSYTKAIDLNPEFEEAYNNLVIILNFYVPKKYNKNLCIKSSELLQNINFNYNLDHQISDIDVKNFFKICNNIIFDNLKKLKSTETQIYRRNEINLNCDRHFDVFNNFNVIPKYCFGCFKVLIEPINVMELFKLYIVFDNLNLKNNNTRKCMLELRPNISGSYKGYIYCTSLNEAYEIQNQVDIILKKKIKENYLISVKRGCSEFGVAYPEFKKVNKNKNTLMKYNEEWKQKENLTDIHRKEKNILTKKTLQKSLKGVTVNDILIMHNWLGYAKKIGDLSYKNITEDVTIHPAIEKELSGQLLKRSKVFTSTSINK